MGQRSAGRKGHDNAALHLPLHLVALPSDPAGSMQPNEVV
jgi:hypothetical protein